MKQKRETYGAQTYRVRRFAPRSRVCPWQNDSGKEVYGGVLMVFVVGGHIARRFISLIKRIMPSGVPNKIST